MINANNTNRKSIVKNTIASLLLVSGMAAAVTDANAYDLKANTIYANVKGGIYKINLDLINLPASNKTNAVKVADTNESYSSIQDIAFDGSTAYGMNLNWQLLKIEPSQNKTVAINSATSYSHQYRGLEARGGELYAAETRSLQKIDKATGKTRALAPGATGYGLGGGEQVDDLAFAEDGTLYAMVSFPRVSYGNSYLATLNKTTGSLTLIGSTGVSAMRALTVKDGILFAMNSVGDLYALDPNSGNGIKVASAVLPGVYGMDTSPVNLASPKADSNGDDEGGAGGLSVYLVLAIAVAGWLRRFR